jgi:glycosyltransferase involved in cell wall biosynthesis
MPLGNNKIQNKPRIAMIAMGVIGGGVDGKGIPAVTEMIHHISKEFDIVYYSFQRVDVNILPSIKVKQVLPGKLPGRLKYLLLGLQIITDHLFDPYQFLYSIAVFPTGRMAVRIGKIIRRPVIVQLLALEAAALKDIQYGNLVSPFLTRISQWVCREADEVIVLSQYQNDIAKRSLPTTRDFTVIPLSIDCDKFQYNHRDVSYPVKFIHVSYYHPVKDQATLFRAFAKIASVIDCELTVIGNGFDNARVRGMLKDLNILHRVFFKGQVMNKDLPVYFSAAHLMLHTSLYESECIVALEAMASGIPVCSTRVGILADLGDESAVLVPPGDAEALAENTIELINNPLRYSTIQQKAYEWIIAHDARWSAEKYAATFRKWL